MITVINRSEKIQNNPKNIDQSMISDSLSNEEITLTTSDTLM